MNSTASTDASTTAFALPDRLAAKRRSALIAHDDRHFAAIADSIDRATADLVRRLEDERRKPGGSGQEALDRDLEIHRLSAQLRALRRYRIDACLGRVLPADGSEPLYIGRFGLMDAAGARLLADWRSPMAEPFFAATPANPLGMATRRRYRWTGGSVSDYWDEVLDSTALDRLGAAVAMDDDSAFLASLGSSRSSRMRDVLGTIQADQDAIIRAPSRGALVVEGGPGTGKTVVALHRAAYLLYSDPRLGAGRGGLLFVGPHEPYLAYVSDVLPGLGEEGVRTCTLRELVPEGAGAREERDPDVARLKSSAQLLMAVDAAVAWYERPPTRSLLLDTAWGEVMVTPEDWAEAFLSADPAAAHNDARDDVWNALLDIVVDRFDPEEVPFPAVRRALARNEDLARTFRRTWPVLDPARVVADLWSVPEYLSACAPWLTPAEVRVLQRGDGAAWTASDLPILDAARQRIGDPDGVRTRRRREAEAAGRQEEMDRMVDHLIQTDDSELMLMWMLREPDMHGVLVDDETPPPAESDALAGPFGHVIVDEAQELTDAEWQMLLRRCPSRSFTIVGDRAQARRGSGETWEQRLQRVGMRAVSVTTLTVNYRTPEEVMAEAEPVIRAVLPDANVPTALRRSGVPVQRGVPADLDRIVSEWLAAHSEGVACVIGAPKFAPAARVQSLDPQLAKGLEFDLVVVVDDGAFGSGVDGAVDRYVAMTRATQQLVVLTPPDDS